MPLWLKLRPSRDVTTVSLRLTCRGGDTRWDSLLHETAAGATVRTASECTVLAVSHTNFPAFLRALPDLEHRVRVLADWRAIQNDATKRAARLEASGAVVAECWRREEARSERRQPVGDREQHEQHAGALEPEHWRRRGGVGEDELRCAGECKSVMAELAAAFDMPPTTDREGGGGCSGAGARARRRLRRAESRGTPARRKGATA